MTALPHVALLRGINVGRARRVAMADLRALVEGLGYGEVRTLLNSGNVVFTAPPAAGRKAAAAIEGALVRQLGVPSRVTVLSGPEVARIIAENPLGKVAVNPSLLLVAVLMDPAHRVKLDPLRRQKWAPEALGVASRAAYLWCPNGQIESPLATAVWRALGDGVTARNWATFTKLAALAAPEE